MKTLKIDEAKIIELGTGIEKLASVAIPKGFTMRVFCNNNSVQDVLTELYEIRNPYDGAIYFGVVRETLPRYDDLVNEYINLLKTAFDTVKNELIDDSSNIHPLQAMMIIETLERMIDSCIRTIRDSIEAFSELYYSKSVRHYNDVRAGILNMINDKAPKGVNDIFNKLYNFVEDEFSERVLGIKKANNLMNFDIPVTDAIHSRTLN